MRTRRRTITRTVVLLGTWAATTAAVCVASPPQARAVDDLDDEVGLPAPATVQDAEEPPVDMRKHGTVEAEIPPTRESTTGPPTRAELNARLTDPLWPRGTFFIGVAGHYAFEVTDQIGGKRMLAPGGGASMRMGLRHDRFWSSEFSGLWTSKFKDAGVEYNGWGAYMGERFYFTKARWQPYVGAQVGFLQLKGTNFDGKQFGFAPKFSAGLEFYLTETLNLDLDTTYYYTVGAIEGSDFVTVSLGINWF